MSSYPFAHQRLIILDYDGVIVPEVTHPELTIPHAEIISCVDKLAGDPKNTVVLLSNKEISASIRALSSHREFALYAGPKQIELTTRGIDAGSFIPRWIGGRHFDFVLAIGEEQTDHNLFGLFTNGAFTIRVYPTLMSNARYSVKDRTDAILLIKEIASLFNQTIVSL